MGDETPVTRYELELVVEPMREDIREIKGDVKALRGNTWLGPRGHEFMVGGSLLGVIAALLLSLFH